MKTILKLIGGMLIGVAAGVGIAALGIVIFTDTTFSDFLDKLLSTNGWEGICAALVGMLTFLLSIVILTPIHEAGHLICGLLTGYKFVSFRVFNFTLIKVDGKLKVKKFIVPGTGGQCLLSPPDLPLERIPTVWYNAGGVLANILGLLIVIPLFFLDLSPFAKEALVIFCMTDAFLILTNGIPLKIGGISNDAYNIIYLNRNLLSKQALMVQLRSNALLQHGMRPKDMPEEWFEWRTDIDFRNPLEVSIPLIHASRLIDEMRWNKAYGEFSELYGHKTEIMPLYVNEIACELAFCALVTGHKSEAEQLLDKKLRKYIGAYKKVMSAKLRLACAIALYIEGDRDIAEEIYRTLSDNRGKYLLQGEVSSDLAIMHCILNE